ncbi:hypothetical protein CYMTET_34569 [Cymbomonas tetramitiformis]|uniref:Uncharacterized protein n=1 Tax=Cymbomonas tetramitiformis TaxID=36881 RepID=A0AAE0FB33_9CHLO|nr:hypothetical protein CYMTET_34569 [Cymbomonas tetramitiformis]
MWHQACQLIERLYSERQLTSEETHHHEIALLEVPGGRALEIVMEGARRIAFVRHHSEQRQWQTAVQSQWVQWWAEAFVLERSPCTALLLPSMIGDSMWSLLASSKGGGLKRCTATQLVMALLSSDLTELQPRLDAVTCLLAAPEHSELSCRLLPWLLKRLPLDHPEVAALVAAALAAAPQPVRSSHVMELVRGAPMTACLLAVGTKDAELYESSAQRLQWQQRMQIIRLSLQVPSTCIQLVRMWCTNWWDGVKCRVSNQEVPPR